MDASARLVATAAAADLLRRLRDVVGAMIVVLFISLWLVVLIAIAI